MFYFGRVGKTISFGGMEKGMLLSSQSMYLYTNCILQKQKRSEWKGRS